MRPSKLILLAFVVAVIALVTLQPRSASAHCDTLSGPVVSAARRALETGNVNLALVWVQPDRESAIRAEFDKARAAQQSGGRVKEAADTHFFEALVRIHREGEGAPFTGLKPAGADIGVAVPAADRALASGSIIELQKLVGDAVQGGTQQHFQEALERRRYDTNDVTAGRAYVKAYVEYTHYVEGLYQTATRSAPHEPGGAAGHGDRHVTLHAGDGSHQGHGEHESHLPWILVGVLGFAVAGETAWIVTRRRRE